MQNRVKRKAVTVWLASFVLPDFVLSNYYLFLSLQNSMNGNWMNEMKTHLKEYFASTILEKGNNETSWEMEEDNRAEWFIYNNINFKQ